MDLTLLRVCSWNVMGASAASAVWQYLMEIRPALALLQEVRSMPLDVSDNFHVLDRRAASESGGLQAFHTVVLVRKDSGTIGRRVSLTSELAWVDKELALFDGNLVGCEVTLGSAETFRVVSVYSPAWPLDPKRFPDADVSPIKLQKNPDLWVTDLLWAGLKDVAQLETPLIVAGDFNASITFDSWAKEGRGNDETMQRMADLGLVECLASAQGRLTPTFKNLRGGKIVHQMDHLFVSQAVAERLVDCVTGVQGRVFGSSLSDHLPIIATFNARFAKDPI